LVIIYEREMDKTEEHLFQPWKGVGGYTGFVVSKTKKIQRLSKIFSAYFERLFKDL
jgi:hypothetical protein